LALRREQVASTVASILGASVPPDQPLMEAGLDSLGAVDLRNALGQRFALKLPATATFDHPTVEAMAAYIGAALGPLQQQQERQVAAPRWRGSAVAAAGADFGAPTSAAVQVVGLSCVYPGEILSFTIGPLHSPTFLAGESVLKSCGM
jgi:acyl carrier protein